MVEEIKVREGYKKTEIGVIPEDWSTLKVKDVMSFSGGSQPPKYTFISERKPGYIRLIQIRDYKSDNFITFIPEDLANKKCNKDDVMIGRYGPPIFQILRGIEGAYNVALMKAIPSELIKREYLYYFLKQESLFNFIELLSRRSSGQTGVDIVALKEYPINLPSLKEQDIITIALTDTDNLIHSIEKLIDKKEKIKQGTMQELLTGKKRLDGFSGEWEVNKLENVVINISSGTSKTKSDKGKYKVYGSTGVIGYNNFYDYTGYCILVARVGANAGKVGLGKGKYCVTDNTLIINYDNNIDLNFLYYYLINFRLNRLVFGSGQPLITGAQLKKISVSLPPLDEQKSISKILSDMDQEIQKLKEKLEKYKTIKKGMMQELLTGRVRLI